MTRALFVSHTAQFGGAELFMQDMLLAGDADWRAAFLSDGPAAESLRRQGRPPVMLAAGQAMLAIRRNASIGNILVGLGDLFRVATELARHLGDVDVVCANSQKALFVCAIAARLARKPLVWILHDILTEPAFSNTNRRAAVFFARHFADVVVVNSKASGDAFVAAGGELEKLRVIHNGFDLAGRPVHDPARAAAMRSALGLDQRPLVGLFGRLSEWKGQHVLLDALAQAPQVQAIIVGAALFSETRYEADLRARCSRLGLDDRVHFLGFRKDVPDLMAAVDIVVHTTTAPEPFGRVVVEGLLAARPVIATRGGGVAEIVTDGETALLVPPADPTALATAIKALLDDPATMARLSRAGQADATRRFSRDAMVGLMAPTLQDAIQRQLRAGAKGAAPTVSGEPARASE